MKKMHGADPEYGTTAISRRQFMIYLGLVAALLLAGVLTQPFAAARLPGISGSSLPTLLSGLSLAVAGGVVVALWDDPRCGKVVPVWVGALIAAAASIAGSLVLQGADGNPDGTIGLLPVLCWGVLAVHHRIGSCRGEHDATAGALVWMIWAFTCANTAGLLVATFGLLVLLWVGWHIRAQSSVADSAGATLVLLSVLVFTSPYRRDRFLAWLDGEHPFTRPLQHEQVIQTLNGTGGQAVLPGANDQFLLTVLAGQAGVIPALLLAALSMGLLIWSIKVLVLARADSMWQRTLGLWIAGYLLFCSVINILTNFAIARLPPAPGLPFFSPNHALLLYCGLLVGAVYATGQQGHTDRNRPIAPRHPSGNWGR